MLARIRAASAAALEQGTLKPIDTETTILPAQPPFVIRIIRGLSQKDSESNHDTSQRDPTASAPPPKTNPFLPYDPTMYVQDVASSHVALLNKYKVVDHHLVVVTKQFEKQSTGLTAADMEAIWGCQAAASGVSFFNSGQAAGASQTHKHIQHICGSVSANEDEMTCFDSVLDEGARQLGNGVGFTAERLRFVHSAMGMRDVTAVALGGDLVAAGEVALARYRAMLQEAGRGRTVVGHNVLATRDWMMVVPRRRECFQGVSVNALGFAGCLLLRDHAQLRTVREIGAMQVLCKVGFSQQGE